MIFDGMSFWHWAIMVLFIALAILPLFPIAAILKKAGYNQLWALVWLVPYANILGFVIFAYAKWPVLRK